MKRVKRNLVSECKMHKWSNNSNNETEWEFASMVCVRAKLRKLHHLSFSLSVFRAIASGIHPVLALKILSKWTQLVVSSGHGQQMQQQQK